MLGVIRSLQRNGQCLRQALIIHMYARNPWDPPGVQRRLVSHTELQLLRNLFDGNVLDFGPNNERMATSMEPIAVSEQYSEERSSSESKDLVTSRTESTLYSSSRSESLWNTSHRSAWDIYQKPIVIMSVGGSVFLLGIILTTMYFMSTNAPVSKNLGPVAFSIGLMVLIVGLVWVPIIRKKRKQRSSSRLFNHQRQLFFHF